MEFLEFKFPHPNSKEILMHPIEFEKYLLERIGSKSSSVHTLLENMFSTSVIYDFLYRFLTDVECIVVNIGSKKSMLTLNLQHRLFK